MKRLFFLPRRSVSPWFIFFLFSIQPVIAQEKPKDARRDTTFSVSIEKFDARLQELQSELEKQIKTKDQAQKVLQQTEDNIKALQSAIQAMMMVKQDTTLHVPTKFKK